MSTVQKFEHYGRKLLPASSSIVRGMKNRDLRQIVARNLAFFMSRPGCLYRNANALAVVARIAPNSVRNLLDPKKRTVTAGKPEGYPTLDLLEKIASKLPCHVWELLHPDIEKSLIEREMYVRLEQNFKTLPQGHRQTVKQ